MRFCPDAHKRGKRAEGREKCAHRRVLGEHWREASSPAPEAVSAPADTTAEDAAKLAKAIADHPRAMTKMEIRRLARDELGRKRGDAAYAVIKGNW